MYRERGISETKTVLEQKTAYGWRKASYDSVGYQDWLAQGNTPVKKPFTPRPVTPPYTPSLEELRERKILEISEAWRNDIENVGMPVPGYDFHVDYDIQDSLIWENSLGFIAPELTEIEVRAIDNNFHAIPRTLFEAIPSMQKAYYAQQIQRKWQKQKEAMVADVTELGAISWES